MSAAIEKVARVFLSSSAQLQTCNPQTQDYFSIPSADLFEQDRAFPDEQQWQEILKCHKICRAFAAALCSRIPLCSTNSSQTEEYRLLRSIARPLAPTKHSVDLTRVFEKTVEAAGKEMQQSEAVFLSPPNESNLCISADKDLIGELFAILLSNAQQAIRKSGPAGRIEILSQQTNDSVLVGIKDTGCGVTPERLSAIFFPLYGEGAGLGLYRAVQILDAHGGRMKFCSQPERGTVVHLRFPHL